MLAWNCVRLTVFVTDMAALRPLVNKVQAELWAGGPYPPRTIVEVAKLSQDDIFEVGGLTQKKHLGWRRNLRYIYRSQGYRS